MKRKVLIIDDEDVYRTVVASALGNEPYELLQAESPEAGIAMLEQNPRIAVILLDLSFQESDFRVVLSHIGAPSPDHRVIVLTGHGELMDHEEARAYGVFTYLSKTSLDEEMTSSNEAIRFSIDQAFKDLERAELDRKLTFLQNVQTKITSNADFGETLDLVCRAVRSMVGAFTCHIRVYNFGRGDYDLAGFAGADDFRRIFKAPRAKGDRYSGIVVKERRARYEPDLQETDEFRAFAKEAQEDRTTSLEEEAYWTTVRSAYIVPIATGVFDPAVDAVLNVSSDKVDFFDDAKKALVQEFVTQAALVITKQWLQERRNDVHSDYTEISLMLSEMSEALDKASPDRSIYDVMTERISAIVSPEIVSVFLHEKSRDVLVNVAERRGTVKILVPKEEYERDESLTGRVFAQDATRHVPEPGASKREKPIEDNLHDIPSKRLEHYLGVPIRIGGEARGVVRAVNKTSEYYKTSSDLSNELCLLERGFSRDCRHAVEIAASHLSVAIRNAELIREKERKVEQISALGDVGRTLTSSLDTDEVLNLAIERMAEVVDTEICLLFLLNSTGDRVALKKCYGIPMPDGWNYKLGEKLTGMVAKTGQHSLIKTVDQKDGKYDDEIRQFLSEKHGEPTEIESLMIVPIIARGKTLGVMKVINKTGKTGGHLGYSEWDLQLFRTFADYAGLAIENAGRLAIAERNGALSLLVSAVAHEINNTSGVIPANVKKIRELLGPSAKLVDRMLTRIDDAASQATEFANEIAGFSANRVGIRQPVDIQAIIRTTVDQMDLDRYRVKLQRARRGSDDIWLNLSLGDTGLVCDVFATPFAQIIRNIAINAFQALEGRSDGKLLLQVSRVGDKAVIRFEDNGPGVKPENRERIFKPDFTTKPKGNGIGLWLVQNHLESVQGKIGVDSVLGRGATFTVTVPLYSDGSSAV